MSCLLLHFVTFVEILFIRWVNNAIMGTKLAVSIALEIEVINVSLKLMRLPIVLVSVEIRYSHQNSNVTMEI